MRSRVSGETLRAVRVGAGLSQSALGALVGSSQREISYYENGQKVPPDKFVRAALKACREHDAEAEPVLLTLDEVAGELGCSVSTVRRHIARKRLRTVPMVRAPDLARFVGGAAT